MNPLIFQTDFGVQDGAVSAMYGVAYTVCPELRVFDLTHEIEPYDIWDASYRLIQAVAYWPEGTVFVSVVDPGVGSTRRSIVAKTQSGQYIVTPDNGTLTHIKRRVGITAARIIDETVNRRSGSEESYTFHGMCTPIPAQDLPPASLIFRRWARRWSRTALWSFR